MQKSKDWNHFEYVYGEGHTARVRFDVACAFVAPSSHNHCVRVLVHGPVHDFEEQLEVLLKQVDCILVGVTTYHQTTAFVLQIEDPQSFAAAESGLLNAVAAPVELERSEGWGFFDERVCPTEVDWRRIADREQCEQHALDGLDLDSDREVAHGFYGDKAALERIRIRLLSEGLTVHSTAGDRLVMVRIHSLCTISEVSVPLARFARTHGVAYDGWKPAEMW